MHIRVLVLLISLPVLAIAGGENNGRGARPIALANAFVAGRNSPWSTICNPAALASCHDYAGTFFVSPRQFGLEELRTISAAGVVPFDGISVGFVLGQFGFDLYQETEFTIGAGVTVDDGIAVGGAFNLTRFSLGPYGAATVTSYDLAALLDIVDEMRIGFEWKNFTAAKIGGSGESLSQILAIGLWYDLTSDSHMTMEMEKDIHFPFSLKMGFEQDLLNALTLRIGMSNNPDKVSCGLGVRVAGFELSYAGYSHPQLGWTHQVEISFTMKQ